MQEHGTQIEDALHGASRAASPHHAAGVHAPHELPNWISILNSHFPDSPVVQFLHQWENVIFSLLIASMISIFAIFAARKKNPVPEGIQNVFEAVVDAFEGFITGIIGPEGRRHVPYLGTLFLYILFMNWFGLFPLMKSPTAAWSTTIAIALTTMVYVQIAGIRSQGFWHYLKHLAGNPSNIFGIVLIPLMLSLNLILEIVAVPFSLSLRLFANISSEDRLLLNFASMAVETKYLSFPLQLFANILAVIFSLIQAFVFTLLSTVYIALLSTHDNSHGHTEHESHETQSHETSVSHAHA